MTPTSLTAGKASALKQGVRLHGLAPQMVLAAMVVSSHLPAGVPLFITSANDGTHPAHSVRHPRSLHYEGRAFDFRLPSRTTGLASDNLALCAALRDALGADFDVVLESDHVHVEWDPKEE
jgi:hypothetical protein